jgi:hypothetical protein
MTPPAKLYRRSGDRVEYWESWVEEGGDAVIHHGVLGERGTVERFADRGEYVERVAATVRELHAEGFANIPEEEHAELLVQIPPEAIPDPDAVEPLWDRLELWVDETLGWTGLGHCTGVDYSSEMTAMALAVDADLAVRVLADSFPESGLPDATIVGVREEDGDVVRWPPERAGEPVPPA